MTPFDVARARKLHEEILVADIHSHALLGMTYLRKDLRRRHRPPLWWNPLRSHQDIPRARQGGLGLWVFVVYSPVRPPRRCARNDDEALRQIRIFEEFVRANADHLVHARNTDDVMRARAGGKVACVLAMEGGHHLEGRIDNLEKFRARGVCYLTLTHFYDNGIAQSANALWRGHEPLTPFGRDVVREMHRLGLIVDIAHCTDASIEAVFDACPEAVICTTHTGVRAVHDIPRNIGDEQVRAVAARGGVIGIIALRTYLGGIRASVSRLVDHIDHLAGLVGTDSIAIGTDFDGFIWSAAGLRDQSDFPRITEALVSRGYGDIDIRKIWGENILRVLAAGWDRW